MATWWSRYPEAFEREKRALDERGFSWSIDQDAFDKGRLVILVQVAVAGVARQLTAYYPDTFPYFAPQVAMRGERLKRHHNPDGFLCLLERDGEDWTPGEDTLASILITQLPKIEKANEPDADADAVAESEERAGEPLSNFLDYSIPEVVQVPDATPAANVSKGRLQVLVSPEAQGRGAAIGSLDKILDASGHLLIQNPVPSVMFTSVVAGFWCRLDQRPAITQAGGSDVRKILHELLLTKCPELGRALGAAKRSSVLFGALLYQDEVSWRANKDDWVLLKYEITRERKGAREAGFNVSLVRADWSGEESFLRRAPFLRPLRSKSVLLVGAGNVGSPVGVQLARAGVGRLDIVDPDVLQAGNTVRWALGRRDAGHHKAVALAASIRVDFPLTQPYAHPFAIGHCVSNPEDTFDCFDVSRSLIDKADLVVDGTASFRASHFLADMCRSLNKPYVWMTTTHGAAGGVVGRILPGHATGCWHCFQRRLADKSIRLPADSGAGEVQPGGCTHPTFIGAGVDSDEIAVLASRLAIATLCRGAADGYLDFDWDVAVADLQANGRSTAPVWSTYQLAPHPECPACGQK